MRTHEQEPFDVTGARAVVVGAARSGVAAAELLASRGAQVVLTDLRPTVPDAPVLESRGIRLELGPHRRDTFLEADLVVVSPGVPLTQPDVAAARAAGIEVIGELELASRWLRGTVVAVTGTKGKSTTTTLIGRMLDEAGAPALVGGNIGVPLSAQVAHSSRETVHVVEVSSFQLEATARFRPAIAVLLNLTPDHLDRHASFAEYAAAKARILARQTADDWVVPNVDDPQVRELVSAARARRFSFGITEPVTHGVHVDSPGGFIVVHAEHGVHRVMPVAEVRLLGRHSLYDVLAAVAVGSLLGLADEAMTRAVEGFSGLEHALEPVAAFAGVRFVNDSKATNVAAARLAVESVGDGVVLILGGRYKGGDFATLGPALRERRGQVVAIGESRARIHQALDAVVGVHDAETLDAAVRQAFALASPGATVLLAPGCSSFDMFVDYADRGRAFKAAVQQLRVETTRVGEQ